MGFTSSRLTRGLTENLLDEWRAKASGGLSAAGVSVNNKTVCGIPAIQSAVEFAAEAVAQLRKGIWQGDGPLRERVTTGWQADLFNGQRNPLQDDFTFWHTVEASLEHRNSAYIWKTVSKGKVVVMTALHPDQVGAVEINPFTREKTFKVAFAQGYPIPPDVAGYGTLTVTSAQIVHVVGRGSIGEVVPLTPIELFRTSLGLPIAKQEYSASLLANHAANGLVVSFPQGTKKAEADEWREAFDARHAGPMNIGKTKVVGGGADVKTISMTPQDAQFVESVELSVYDMAMIYHVPAWLLGVAQKANKPQSPEHELQRWRHMYLGPRLMRLESAINADPSMFGPGSRIQFGFDTADIIHGDLLTEADISIRKVQAGIWVADEARSRDGLPPLPDGAGQIIQITPVGGTPNEKTPPASSQADEA